MKDMFLSPWQSLATMLNKIGRMHAFGSADAAQQLTLRTYS